MINTFRFAQVACCLLFLFSCLLFQSSCAQLLHKSRTYTRADTLRGSITAERAWWDVLHYDVAVTPDYAAKTIRGKTIIQYKITQAQHTDYMQIDLQQPLKIDSFFYDGKLYINYPGRPYYNEGNVWHLPLPKAPLNSVHTIGISYNGKPREAIRPPWDGGWIWRKDAQDRPWMSVACQGLGASVWFPCKDHQSDEPDSGATLRITVPDSLTAIGNGRLVQKTSDGGLTTSVWRVTAPINNYTIIPYIGKYAHWSDTLMGGKGKLDLNYWVLESEKVRAQKQFEQVKLMLRAFEYWFGPYPFYEDGYQLIEAPHLGMEHQSAVAYGNRFSNGYLGSDLSGTGWGLKWDYIIVHESGHEWFANNITTKDIADMWVHEGFTDYSEVLFTEYYYGKKAGDEYCQGLRKNIRNDAPIIGPYNVNQEGSGDMYYKGANLIHTVRTIINDDSLFRNILRGLNRDFYHQIVTTGQVEAYISKQSRKDLGKIFDQYLRTVQIPVFEYKLTRDGLSYRWTNCISGFNMPVSVTSGETKWLQPVPEKWQTVKLNSAFTGSDLQVDKNMYITVKKTE